MTPYQHQMALMGRVLIANGRRPQSCGYFSVKAVPTKTVSNFFNFLPPPQFFSKKILIGKNLRLTQLRLFYFKGIGQSQGTKGQINGQMPLA